MYGVKVVTGAAAAVLLMACVDLTPALADTIEAALVRAYQNNPQLNAQRAQVRSTDENVPQALSGYRPRVALTGSAGYQYTDTQTNSGSGVPNGPIIQTITHGANATFQRPANRQQNPCGGESGLRRARGPAGS